MTESRELLERYLFNLGRFATISPAAHKAFAGLPTHATSHRKAQTIVHEGEPAARFHLITQGSAYRYKTLRTGERQILSFHTANDIVDFQPDANALCDFGVRACEPLQVLSISAAALMGVVARFADLAQALWLSALAEATISREWLTNCGRRSTRNSIIHLLLEMANRFKSDDPAEEWKFHLRFTQAEIADAVGSSPVQVNRILQALRAEHLIRSYGSTIVIEEYDTLARESDFTPTYLGLA